jgi:serine protease
MRTTALAALAVAAVATGTVLQPIAADDDAPVVAQHGLPRVLAPGAHREGELIVGFVQGTSDGDMERMLRGRGVRAALRSRYGPRVLAKLDPGMSVTDAVTAFSRLAGVAYAEPNGLVSIDQAATFHPNDSLYRYQWNFTQLNAERTWGIQKGKSAVAVAVIDTGVAFEDYADPVTGQQFRKAPDWGDTRFLPGYDFVNDDAHPNDDQGHGTHVASTIAEATNNSAGLAGLAFGCAILPVKVLGADGVGSFFAVAEGIDFAVAYSENGAHPVRVINLSLSSPSFSQTAKSAIDRAVAAGVLVVAAAGNGGAPGVRFPANQDNVVAVGALDAAKQKAWYSSTGPEIDLVAPGGDCERDDDGDGAFDCVYQQTLRPSAVDAGRYDDFCYCGMQGTSMATPHVAAAAALLFSQGFTDAAAVRKALEQSAERLGDAPAGGRNDTYGYGLVQPAAALPGLGFNVGSQK